MILLFLVAHFAFAQTTGKIRGVVTDEKGIKHVAYTDLLIAETQYLNNKLNKLQYEIITLLIIIIALFGWIFTKRS